MCSASVRPVSRRRTASASGGQAAEGGAAAGEAGREPRPALLRPRHQHGDVAGGDEAGLAHAGDRGEAGQHAGRTVVVAALADRIEMAADHQHRRRPVRARQGQQQVAGGIDRDLQPQRPRPLAHDRVRNPLARPIGFARDADAVEGRGAQGGEQCLGQGEVGGDVGAHRGLLPGVQGGARAPLPQPRRPGHHARRKGETRMKPRLLVSRQMPAPVGARVREAFDCPWPDGRDMDAEEVLRQLARHAGRGAAVELASEARCRGDRAHPRACARRRHLQRRLRAYRRGRRPRARTDR